MSGPSTPDPATPGPASPERKPAAPRDRVIDALMRLAADRPWDDIEVTDIAEAAEVTLSEFRDLFPSKGAVLGGLARRIDKQVLEGSTGDLAGEPPRERLFDVLMRRLDAMEPYKPALRRISLALRGDLASLAALNAVALNSQRFMLAAAGIPTEGPLGRLKLQGTVVVFANTMETWFTDDDPSLARTMARLDRELRRGERVLERAEEVRRFTAPVRALGQALAEAVGGRRRRRARARPRDEGQDPAAAI